jgi:predicted dehydrogenase
VGEAPAQNRQMSHWLRVVEGKEEPMVRPVETLNVQKIIDAAYRSAAEAREVSIGE